MSAVLTTRPLRWATKDPQDTLDYCLDWIEYLTAEDGIEIIDQILSVTWTVPAGLGFGDKIISGTKTVIWLVGGTPGVTYEIVCSILTTDRRVIERTALLLVAHL